MPAGLPSPHTGQSLPDGRPERTSIPRHSRLCGCAGRVAPEAKGDFWGDVSQVQGAGHKSSQGQAEVAHKKRLEGLSGDLSRLLSAPHVHCADEKD